MLRMFCGADPTDRRCARGPRPCAIKRRSFMADWRKLAINTLLADGKIDDDEIKALKKELWADGKIDADEVRFLVSLRNAAQKKAKARKEEVNPKFTALF